MAGDYLELPNGIMEYWVLKTEFILILISVFSAGSKKRFHPFKPIIPTFQYSIIPSNWPSAPPFCSDPAQ